MADENLPDATLRRSLGEMWKEDISRLRNDATERKRVFPFRSADGRTLFIEFPFAGWKDWKNISSWPE
jgi:hypothetical protein